MVIGAGIVTLYSMLGGFITVVAVDAFQAILMIITCVVLPIAALFIAAANGIGFADALMHSNVALADTSATLAKGGRVPTGSKRPELGLRVYRPAATSQPYDGNARPGIYKAGKESSYRLDTAGLCGRLPDRNNRLPAGDGRSYGGGSRCHSCRCLRKSCLSWS